MKKMLGITMAFNEADFIGKTIECLLDSGHDAIHVFDHGSTDGTGDVARSYDPAIVTVHRWDRTKIPFIGMFGILSRFVRQVAGGFEWVTWMAADEVLVPPHGGPARRGDFEREWLAGTQVIRPLLREFWITEKDDPAEPDPIRRLRFYRPRPEPNCPRSWQRSLTGTMPHGLHRQAKDWGKGVKISHNKWFLDHYPIRTLAQGKRRIMKERPLHPRHYVGYFHAGCANLLKKSRDLEFLPLPVAEPAVPEAVTLDEVTLEQIAIDLEHGV